MRVYQQPTLIFRSMRFRRCWKGGCSHETRRHQKGWRRARFPKVAIMLSLPITVLLLTSCNGSLRTQMLPVRTDQLLESSTRNVLSTQVMDIEQLAQTIAATYKIAVDKVAVYDESAQDLIRRGSLRLYGGRATTISMASTLPPINLFLFKLGYNKHPPNVNDILLCLGAPESYLAWYGFGTSGEAGMGLLLKLFYPQQGIIATTNVNMTFANASKSTAPIPTDVARLPVGGIRFSQPRETSADLLQDYLAIDLAMDFAQEPGKVLLPWYEQLLWPWPGDIHQLKYSTLAYPEIPLAPNQSSP